MGLDLGALQSVMSKVNSTTLNAAMAAYFNGSANATTAFAMLDPAAAAAITEMLNGTDLSSFVGMTTAPTANATGGAALSPAPIARVSIPPLPRPGIFDAPSNPYLNGLDTGGGALSSLMAGLSPEAQNQAELVLVNEMVKAAKKKSYEISMLLLLGFLLVLIFNVVLIIHIRYNRHLATKGNAVAARKIVLPAFEPLLWTYSVILIGYIIFWSTTIHADFMTVQSTFVSIEMAYGCKQVLYLLVPIYMMQKSLSVPALIRAIAITLVASYYTVPIVWAMQQYGKPDHPHQLIYYWVMWTSRWLTFLPFLYVCTWPPARASARAFREYFLFYLVVQCLYFSACEIFHQGGSIDLGTKFGWASAVWVGLCPYVIWRVLKADTEHWRGIGKRAVELQNLFRRNGLVEERISAKGLHVLIEMHRKFIIDFANLDIQHKIGEGTNSMVFRGRLNAKQTPVAIKVFTPANVNEDTVAEFSHEAALCGALQHPNILKFYGMCVCPPTISFVHELCQGSLQDITRTMAKKSIVNPHRQQFLINIGYMVDAARAVAYLHSFSPPYVHRDIRPSSFLVDAEGFVKLTDFGASRTLSVRNAPLTILPAQTTTVILNRGGPQTVLSSAPATGSAPSATAQPQAARQDAPQTLKRMPEYMAPEVIRSKNAGASMYGEAADIYALAITMWDVLYPTTPKYAHGSVATATSTTASASDRDSYNQRESDVFERVFAGQRPVLDDHVYPPLKQIITSAWHPDPRMRPRAMQIVKALERIQQETSSVYGAELMDELHCGQQKPSPPTMPKGRASFEAGGGAGVLSFQGARAIERMYALQHVAAEFEAVRLGNMLMDAGFLHHMKHLRSFEYSAALYFFDEDAIQLHQPLAMLEDGVNTPADPATVSGSRRGGSVSRSAHRSGGGKASLGSARKASRTTRHSHASSDHDHDAFMDDHPTAMACACHKLGQKSETTQTTRSRLRLKFKSNDENLLTARLLTDEPNGDFEAFQDQHARDVQVNGSHA